MRTWQEALAHWRDSPTAYGWASDEALFGLIENVHERLTALETARATAPVSDDEEIVEALAKSRYECVYGLTRWGDYPDEMPTYRKFAEKQRQKLRDRGYDVVKRS